MNFQRIYTREMNARLSQYIEPGSLVLLLTLATTVFTFAIIYYAERQVLPNSQIFFVLTVLPVLLTAFFYGFIPGLISATLCSIVFIPRMLVDIRTIGLSASTIQFVAYLSFLHILAYFVADMVKSMRAQAALSIAVRDWDALLSRASNVDEVISFILSQSQKICLAKHAVFLLRNPMDAQWDAITLDKRWPLGALNNGHNQQLTLVDWILNQDQPVYLNRLHQDSTFLADPTDSMEPLESFLACPFINQDGRRMGWLVLLNKEHGAFSQSDFQLISDLVAAGERTLEHAGLFARTDFALAKQVEQLAAIQRMARELNMILNPDLILERALDCALEITNGDAGVIGIDIGGLPRIVRFAGDDQDFSEKEHLFLDIIRSNLLDGDTPTRPRFPDLLPDSQSKLQALIHGGGDAMGVIIVESSHAQAFSGSIDYFLSILADHTGIALENAKLFGEIQNEKQRMDLIFHSVADGLLTTDQNGTILTMNPAAQKLTGWAVEQGVGRHFCEIIGLMEEGREQHDCVLDKAIKEGKNLYEDRHSIHQNSETRQAIALSIAPIMDNKGQTNGAVVLFRDITRQDELDRLQKELIASISHELRTPLANIKSVAEMLASEEFQGFEDEAFQEYLDILSAQSQRLTSFLEAVIDVHRLESGRMGLQIRPLPISLLIENAIRHWRLTDSQHVIRLNVPEKIMVVWADENAVLSILNNLLENAAKYSPPGSQIEVTVDEDGVGSAVISIRDHGAGINQEHLPKIFERFYRVNGGDAQSVYGHGLGLYITKGLVEKMGGKIWVNSESGKGSTFSFSLPVVEVRDE
jgi:PAS domain S-box-containing protein